MSAFPAARFLLSVASPAQFPPDRGREIAFAGRSNAGKSSAINALAMRRNLARTSKTPGRTRLLNYFELAPEARLVDLPGYGFATAPEAERANWAPLIDALAARASLAALFLVVDCRRGVQAGDFGLLDWAAAADKPVQILLSKSDQLGRQELQRAESEARVALQGRAAGVQCVSALNGKGMEAAREILIGYLKLPRRP